MEKKTNLSQIISDNLVMVIVCLILIPALIVGFLQLAGILPSSRSHSVYNYDDDRRGADGSGYFAP